MRGDDEKQSGLFSYISPEQRVPQDHPLRPIRQMCDEVLKGLSSRFEGLYSRTGRPSIAPERLLRALLSDEHFTVDGTLIEAWASLKSFKATGAKRQSPPDDPGNPTVNFHGERRSNRTHQSTTDPESLLMRKGPGKEAKLSYMGHVMMENRNGLAVAGCVTWATGRAECDAALLMLEEGKVPRASRITVAGDKGYDQRSFVEDLRRLSATPHVAQKVKGSAIDGRVVRHAGYAVSQRKRKRVEEIFGWLKTVGTMRKTRHRGTGLVDWTFTFALAAYNLVRMRNLIEAKA